MPPQNGDPPEPSTQQADDHSEDPHYHLIGSDDCILSLADENGLWWKTVWEHANNSEIKKLRGKPSCLRQGDWVYMPELTTRQEPGATEKRHRFRRLGIPAYLHIRLMRDHQPRANLDYQLTIEGTTITGTTNAKGELHEPIPPGARQGVLRTREGDRWSEVQLNLGELDPHKHDSGARARLANLGYSPGSEDEDNSQERLGAAVRTFQEREGLEVTGELDEQTHSHLEKLHDQAKNHQAAEKKEPEVASNWKVHPDLSLRGEDMFDDPFAEEESEESDADDEAENK
jgi:hypothetical protein